MTTQVETSRKTIADRTSQVGKDVEQLRTACKQLAADSADVVRHTANDVVEEGRSKAQEAVATAKRKVQEKPVKSVLVAAAVGFLLGVCCNRKSKNQKTNSEFFRHLKMKFNGVDAKLTLYCSQYYLRL